MNQTKYYHPNVEGNCTLKTKDNDADAVYGSNDPEVLVCYDELIEHGKHQWNYKEPMAQLHKGTPKKKFFSEVVLDNCMHLFLWEDGCEHLVLFEKEFLLVKLFIISYLNS